MKTRIFITALMITFSTCVMAETNQVKSEDTLFTHSLASVNESVSSGMDDMNLLNNNSPVFAPFAGSFENTADLDEWVESRELWEQENSEMTAGNQFMETVDLEEWFRGRESWEQESSESIPAIGVYTSSLLEGWVTNCETWEQGFSETELDNETVWSVQEEWISDMEAWEQK